MLHYMFDVQSLILEFRGKCLRIARDIARKISRIARGIARGIARQLRGLREELCENSPILSNPKEIQHLFQGFAWSKP